MNVFRDYDPADVLISIPNILIMALLMVVAINFLKFATAKFPIPGLTPLVQNV